MPSAPAFASWAARRRYAPGGRWTTGTAGKTASAHFGSRTISTSGPQGPNSNSAPDLPRISGENYLGASTRFVSRDPAGYVDGASLYSGYFSPNSIDPYGLDDPSIGSLESALLEKIKSIERENSNDARLLFLKTQHCILNKLKEGACCGSTEERKQWLRNVLSTFMNSLLHALNGNISNDPNLYLNGLSGRPEWGPAMASAAANTSVMNSPGINPNNVAYDGAISDAMSRRTLELLTAKTMAIVHITADLKMALLKHGKGNDEDWECVGGVVAGCEKDFVSGIERMTSKFLGALEPTFDVARLRDEMRNALR
jgi:hypothetical protein